MEILERVDEMLDIIPSDDNKSKKRKLNQSNSSSKKRKLQNGSATSSKSNSDCKESAKLQPSTLLEFAYLLGNLKKTERTGWVAWAECTERTEWTAWAERIERIATAERAERTGRTELRERKARTERTARTEPALEAPLSLGEVRRGLAHHLA